MAAIQAAGYQAGTDVSIALDVAASELFEDGAYVFKKGDGSRHSAEEMIQLYGGWIEKYPIVSIEDGLAEDDWAGWSAITEALGDKVQLVGDDLFVTNPERLERGLEEAAANAILIKLNQIGTLTETLQCIELARVNELRSARGRSRPGAHRALIALQNTTSFFGLPRSWVTLHTTPARTCTDFEVGSAGVVGRHCRRDRLRSSRRRIQHLRLVEAQAVGECGGRGHHPATARD